MTRILKVGEELHKMDGTLYLEPEIDGRGRVVLETGEAKWAHQTKEADVPRLISISLGKAITHALDQTDDKLTTEERRKRFFLALRVEEALKEKRPLSVDKEDEKRIEEAAALVKNNLLFGRILEALETAEPAVRAVKK